MKAYHYNMAEVILTEEEENAVISKHYAKIGKKGGTNNFKKHGKEHMSRISKLKKGMKYKKKGEEKV